MVLLDKKSSAFPWTRENIFLKFSFPIFFDNVVFIQILKIKFFI